MTNRPHTDLDTVREQLYEQAPALRRELVAWAPVVGIVRTLVTLRKKAGKTQAELAKELGRKQSAIARLESGEIDPKWSTVYATLEALGHRIHIVAESEELVVMTRADLGEFVNGAVREVVGNLMESMQQQAIANALVRVADTKREVVFPGSVAIDGLEIDEPIAALDTLEPA